MPIVSSVQNGFDTELAAHNQGFVGYKTYGHSRKHSDSTEFKEMSKADAQAHLAQELDKLCRTASAAERETIEAEFRGFQHLFHQFVKDAGPSIVWDKIQPVPENAQVSLPPVVKGWCCTFCLFGMSGLVLKWRCHRRSLSTKRCQRPPRRRPIRSMLNKLVVVKLNGGLGTSMGCKGPKSVIPVRNDLTFLDMTVQQIEYLNKTYNANMPLVLMNSFNTDDDTSKVLRKYKGFKVKIYTFLQSRYPRINKETLMPIVTSMSMPCDEGFYPPGHGDFYASFCQSGLMDHFLTEGREYCFISNIDNLGATVDLSIPCFQVL
ncbi:hypothetical protein HPB51_018214 [Rhipicephalus microplus]|uniref:UTP--glucose-1-phosphate uridylyltransferase n=1 Tax=Rhipicephalus microplus TaxID=6941 RepID=A0A9J6E335_RHIMP|nr:hypothetical protein HPB51_018214 [Rhipicephalus microplus]